MLHCQNKNKFYNADELLSRHFVVNMICGDRSAGKTTCIQKYVLKRAISNNEEFAIIVRYDTDCKALCETYFDNTVEMFYSDYVVQYKNKKFYLINKKSGYYKLIGYVFALNMATKKKSTSYPHINTLIFEEFTNIEEKYIKNTNNPELEVELLLSLYSTIARGGGKQVREEVKIIMISNNFYINNPYFRYFKFVDKLVQDPFKRFYTNGEKPKALLEITHNNNKVEYEMARDNTMIANSFIDLRNELNINADTRPKKVLLQLTIDNNNFYSLANFNDTYIFFKDRRKEKELCFSCSEIKKQGIFAFNTLKRQCPDIYATIITYFDNNWVYYDSVDTYIGIYNILHFQAI